MAANGREALAQLDSLPDVVVLDIGMPDMDGNETLEEIQKRSPVIPVIMLTGHGADESAKRALTQGAVDYLSKPCDIDRLASRIVDASRQKDFAPDGDRERTVGDVMILLNEYSTLTEDQTVAEGVAKIKRSFTAQVRTSRIMETGHRSLPVFDRAGKLKGILAIMDLLEAAYMMVHDRCRRMVVLREDQVAGVIREQDLFFELERVMR